MSATEFVGLAPGSRLIGGDADPEPPVRRPGRTDIVVGLVLLALSTLELTLDAITSDPPLSEVPYAFRMVSGVVLGTLLSVVPAVWWRSRPLLAAPVAACSALPLVICGSPLDALPMSTAVAAGLIAYGAAARLNRRSGFAALAILLVGLPICDIVLDTGEDVVPLTFTVLAPWLVGLVSGSRRRVAVELGRIAEELRAEQRRYTEAAVRLERRRAARELHDLVGHAMSLIVVQATAGRHLVVDSPEAARQSLSAIGEAAERARRELVQLDRLDDAGQAGIAELPDLVAGAVRAGLPVTVHGLPIEVQLSEAADHAVYRLVQEALTNVIRYAAPGARVHLFVRQMVMGKPLAHDPCDALAISISNTAGADDTPSRPAIGTGSGLEGLRERVLACGGSLAAGPDPTGWSIDAMFPITTQPPAPRAVPGDR